MAFTKSFPKRSDKSAYAVWKDVTLSEEDEQSVEAAARKRNIEIMEECLSDAKELFKKNDLKDYQSDIVAVASKLFDKRASHEAYWKEEKARQKFEKERN